jgi:hypothetical protein
MGRSSGASVVHTGTRSHAATLPATYPLPVTHRESFSLVLQEKAMPVVHRERDPSSSPPPHEDFVAYATDLAERSILFWDTLRTR